MGIIRDTVRKTDGWMDGQTDRGYLNEHFFPGQLQV